ncbi:MAG: hypothetical protein IJX04_05705 [Oscillospiraceae bacterium]|nr:hypothetical protein [Oscillospiraceae bacterium]
MKIEVLFSEVCNLSGDYQNVEYLRQTLPEAEFVFTALTQEPDFAANRPDMIYMGTMTEATQRRVIEKLMPHKDRIEALIDDGVVFLMTGNACEVFCGAIDYVTEERRAEGLGIFPLTAKTDLFRRYNGKFLGDVDGISVVGFRSQFSFLYGDNSQGYFGKNQRSIGINPDTDLEGVRRKNFFGTNLQGPILPLNPLFCEHLIRLAGGDAPAAHREAAMAAYEQRLKEFRDPSVKF